MIKTLSQYIILRLSREYWWSIKISFRSQWQQPDLTQDFLLYTHSCGTLTRNLIGTLLTKLLLAFIQVKWEPMKGYISHCIWMAEQTCLWLFSSNAAWIKVRKLYFWLIQDDLLIDRQVNKLPFSERFISTFSVYALVCHAAKPQSTMPCNHVMSHLVELGVWTVKKKEKKKKKRENGVGFWIQYRNDLGTH